MSLFDAYKYLYYRIYSWNLRKWGEIDVPQFNALLGVTFLVYLNIITLLIAIQLICRFRILEQIKLSKIHAIVGIIAIGLINYFIFLYNSKYKQLAKQFKKKTEIEKKRRFLCCSIYVVFTFACFFGFILLLSPNSSR